MKFIKEDNEAIVIDFENSKHIKKLKPKYRNRSHFIEVAATDLLKKDGDKI